MVIMIEFINIVWAVTTMLCMLYMIIWINNDRGDFDRHWYVYIGTCLTVFWICCIVVLSVVV